MAFHSSVLSHANHLHNIKKQEYKREQAFHRGVAYSRDPQLAVLDQKLRDTMAVLFRSAIRKDKNVSITELRDTNLQLQQERGQRLAHLGYTSNQVDPEPHCPLCQDEGWVGSQMCDCFRPFCIEAQLHQLSNILDVSRQNFDTFSLNHYGQDVWSGRGDSPRGNMEFNFDVCYDFANKFGKTKIRNLLFSGSPGLGKTFLSACVAKLVTEQGFSVAYETSTQLAHHFDVRKFGRKNQEEHELSTEETTRYLQSDLFILDDLGGEYTTEPIQSALYDLINTRLITGRQTLISTNLSFEDIRKRYSPQVASRFEGEYNILHFFGEDIRGIRNHPNHNS